MRIDWDDLDFILGVEADPEKIVDFWLRNDITVSKTDTPRDVLTASRIFPKLFIVAQRKMPDSPGEHINPVIGTVWGNFDGRRGYIVHLAVERSYRSRGLGRHLMEMVEEEFRRMDVYKIHLFVESHNESVGGFYTLLGYKKRDDLTVYSKTLR
ncbi:MAG: GNAT family N-acetyltransferase [Sediminispirochaetaceae bacterium]